MEADLGTGDEKGIELILPVFYGKIPVSVPAKYFSGA